MDSLLGALTSSTTVAPSVVPPPVAPAESTAARPRFKAGRDEDFLVRQGAKILAAGGSQADVVRAWQAMGVQIKQPITVIQPGGVSQNGGDPHADLQASGAGVLAGANVAGKMLNMPGGLTLKALQGMTFGLGDEAAGAILGLLTGDGASKGIDIYREALNQQQKQAPVTSTLAELGGSVASGVGLGSVLGLGARAAQTGTVGRAALLSGEAGAGGALAGAGNTEGPPSERAMGAVVGGLAGLMMVGAGAGASKIAGTVMTPVVRGLTNWSERLQATLPGNVSASKMGRALLADALGQDGISVSEALARVDKMTNAGVPVTAADIGGENTLGLFQAAAGLRGPAKQRMVEEILGRQGDQGERLLGSLFRSLKLGTENAYDAADHLIASRSAAATPAYQQAYTLDATLGPNAKRLFKEPWAQQAYEIGRQIAGEEDRAQLARVAGAKAVPPLFTDAAPPSAILGPGGAPARAAAKPQLQDALPVRALDYTKRGLDAMREARGSDGAAILDRQQWVARGQLLNQALDEVSQQHPVYAQARSIWKGGADALDAMQLGKGGVALSGATTVRSPAFHTKPPEVVARELAALDPAHQEFYRIGAMQDMSDWVHSLASEAPDVARSKFGGKVWSDVENTMVRRLRALVHDPDVAESLWDSIKGEARLSYTASKFGGSRTAPMQSQMAALEAAPMPRGGVLSRMVGATVEPILSRAKTGWTSAVSDELSNLATKGLRGSDELRAMLLSLKGMAPVHRPVLAITAGSQVGGSAGLR